MSLQIDDGGRRTRSRSPSGRSRSRHRDDGDGYGRGAPGGDAVPYPSDDRHRSSVSYEYERLASWPPVPRAEDEPEDTRYADSAATPRREKEYREKEYREKDRREREYARHERGERESDSDRDRRRDPDRSAAPPLDSFQYLPQKYAQKLAGLTDPRSPSRDSPTSDRERNRDDGRDRDRNRDRDSDRERDRKARRRREEYEEGLAYGNLPGSLDRRRRDSSPPLPPAASSSSPSKYRYEYADVKSYGRDAVAAGYEEPRYSSSSLEPRQPTASARAPSPSRRYAPPSAVSGEPGGTRRDSPSSPGGADPRRSVANVLTVEPGAPRKSAMKRESSPRPPGTPSLTVDTGLGPPGGGHRPGSMSLSAAPASPLLESYHGTYQSMSPMPSPLLMPTQSGEVPRVYDAISPVASDDDRAVGSAGGKKRSRHARFHDATDDAARLAKALRGEHRAPETEALIEILPGLTHEQVMELRAEYKRLVKTGSHRKGVNVAKHIRARLKDEDASLMKACYAVALGRWESEAYWANFWYQGDKTRRELLIEALMGRSNAEVRAIKDAFADKKYGGSLTRCMRAELKEDKFKKAVLAVLDEQRMDDVDPATGRPLRIDYDLVADDVKRLHHAVRSERGGETLMISTAVQRSDSHLREVLRVYSETYRSNFARDALKKSGNLVGEVLAHVLNGVINKPVRDALLLHHALTASRRDGLRRELLISRLVRYHWDPDHMAAVKAAFLDRYHVNLQQAVRDATTGEWGEFCEALCITRVPDHVKHIERLKIEG